ncbi:hypothetical protein CMV_007300 [Castanea mollissima]|uniref:Uncharacterized protein n=1 Tax=Castanea mollissima TaxID=60419 RepID=A0A8J4VSV4_9ROSI|nr:hypothetical protein CMV_007300 [Castanea mollissima]
MTYRYFDSEKGKKGKKKLGSSGRSCGRPSRFDLLLCFISFLQQIFSEDFNYEKSYLTTQSLCLLTMPPTGDEVESFFNLESLISSKQR